MAEILFITKAEMTNTTILGGNVDFDKYSFCVLDTQLRVLEPLLGTELYEKIKTDLEAETLSGLYLEMFNDYVKPITKFASVANYLEIASYLVDNGGVYKHVADNKQVVEKNEVMSLVQKYNGMADMFIIRFQKWICNNHLVEYKTYQDKVNADKDIKTIFGWKL